MTIADIFTQVRASNPRQKTEESCLPRTIPADDSQSLAAMQVQRNILEGPKVRSVTAQETLPPPVANTDTPQLEDNFLARSVLGFAFTHGRLYLELFSIAHRSQRLSFG